MIDETRCPAKRPDCRGILADHLARKAPGGGAEPGADLICPDGTLSRLAVPEAQSAELLKRFCPRCERPWEIHDVHMPRKRSPDGSVVFLAEWQCADGRIGASRSVAPGECPTRPE